MAGKKKEKKATEETDDPALNPAVLLSNYQKYCKLVCIPVNQKVVNLLNDEEHVVKTKQLVIDDEFGSLGPAGTRALCTAIMGGSGASNQCKLVKSLRLWRSDVRDDGAACVSELLRLGGAEILIEYLEILDGDVGPEGALCLGKALAFGQNQSLMTLRLDYNTTLGAEGVQALCQGLRTNSSLKQLHLSYCRIGPEAGAHLGEMLSYRRLVLTVLNLQGNHLGGQGLEALCDNGLGVNTSLSSLSIADNGVGQSEQDLAAVKKLFAIVLLPTSSLTSIDMLYNRIGDQGGNAILNIFNRKLPSKLKQLLLDSTLSENLFSQLCRIDAPKGGKKKKGGGKKKKEKVTTTY